MLIENVNLKPCNIIHIKHLGIVLVFLIAIQSLALCQTLIETTAITITKTWSQEPNGWTYPMAIHVPVGPEPTGGFPVCILLHGFGGNGGGMVYLDGQVVHLSGDAGHSTNQTQKDYITEYFNVQCGTCDAVVSLNGTLTSGVYISSESLTSEASIPANNTVSMLSDTICLGNGFSVEASTELLIEVDPCN